MFAVLSRRRRASLAGPEPVALTEIESLLRMYHVPVEMWPEYVAIFTSLDDAWLADYADRQKLEAERREREAEAKGSVRLRRK